MIVLFGRRVKKPAHHPGVVLLPIRLDELVLLPDTSTFLVPGHVSPLEQNATDESCPLNSGNSISKALSSESRWSELPLATLFRVADRAPAFGPPRVSRGGCPRAGEWSGRSSDDARPPSNVSKRNDTPYQLGGIAEDLMRPLSVAAIGFESIVLVGSIGAATEAKHRALVAAAGARAAQAARAVACAVR